MYILFCVLWTRGDVWEMYPPEASQFVIYRQFVLINVIIYQPKFYSSHHPLAGWA